MISASDCILAIDLINAATTNDAREFKACEALGISHRTLFRWVAKLITYRISAASRRTLCVRPFPLTYDSVLYSNSNVKLKTSLSKNNAIERSIIIPPQSAIKIIGFIL